MSLVPDFVSCQVCGAVTFLGRVRAGRYALFDATPTSRAAGNYAFTGGRGTPTLRPDARGPWTPHFAGSCSGITDDHRAFGAALLRGETLALPAGTRLFARGGDLN